MARRLGILDHNAPGYFGVRIYGVHFIENYPDLDSNNTEEDPQRNAS